MDTVNALLLFKESLNSGVQKEEPLVLVVMLTTLHRYYVTAIETKLSYEGLTYNKNTSVGRDVERMRHILQDCSNEVMVFIAQLEDAHVEQSRLEDESVKYEMFFEHVLSELSVLEHMAVISEKSVPKGVVDWEGENVVNSKATDSRNYPSEPLPKAGLESDKWGQRGGGGQAQALVL
jgi:hypothetical protein